MRVILWEELQAGKVPTPEGHRRVAEHIADRLGRSHLIVGAIHCGSTRRGDGNALSDQDWLIVYRGETAALEQEALLMCADLERNAFLDHSVSVEFVLVDAETISTGFHSLSRSYVEHLRLSAAQGGVVGQNPLDLLGRQRLSRLDDLTDYLGYNATGLRKAVKSLAYLPEAEAAKVLGRCLTVPRNMARKFIAWRIEREIDDKAGVVRRYGMEAAGEPADLLGEIIGAEAAYRDEVERQLEKPDAVRYQAALCEAPSNSLDDTPFFAG